jgi:hypothetical protein
MHRLIKNMIQCMYIIVEGYCRWKLSSGNLYTFLSGTKSWIFHSCSWLDLINVYKFPFDKFHLQYPSTIIQSKEMPIKYCYFHVHNNIIIKFIYWNWYDWIKKFKNCLICPTLLLNIFNEIFYKCAHGIFSILKTLAMEIVSYYN